MGRTGKFFAPVVQIQKLTWWRGQPHKSSLRDVRPFEMLSPRTLQFEDSRVQGLQRRQLAARNVLLNEDQKIDIAVDVEIANCERTLQICADEIIAQHIADPHDEVTQDDIQIRIGS